MLSKNILSVGRGLKIEVRFIIFFIFVILMPACGKIFKPPITILKWNDQLNKTFIMIFTSTSMHNFVVISAWNFIFGIILKRIFRKCFRKNILSLGRNLNMELNIIIFKSKKQKLQHKEIYYCNGDLTIMWKEIETRVTWLKPSAQEISPRLVAIWRQFKMERFHDFSFG